MSESQALKLLASLPHDGATKVHPLDFSSLLYLQDKGHVNVSVVNGDVVAERTSGVTESHCLRSIV
jgi:hypothetical protein